MLSTLVSFIRMKISSKAMVSLSGQMVLFMKDNGKIIFIVAGVNFIIQAETSTKVNSLTIWPMALESTGTRTEANMLGTGSKTSNTDLERKSGVMCQCIKDFMLMHKSRVKESTVGLMVTDTLENGVRMYFMARASLCGLMLDST